MFWEKTKTLVSFLRPACLKIKPENLASKIQTIWGKLAGCAFYLYHLFLLVIQTHNRQPYTNWHINLSVSLTYEQWDGILQYTLLRTTALLSWIIHEPDFSLLQLNHSQQFTNMLVNHNSALESCNHLWNVLLYTA